MTSSAERSRHRKLFFYENLLLALLFATFGFVFFDRLAHPIVLFSPSR